MKYIKYNNNPKNRNTTDCVVRAISLALDKSWEDVYLSMVNFGLKQGLVFNDKRNVKKYLEKYLFLQAMPMPKRKDNTRYTLEEFADELAEKNTIYIVEVAKHHLTIIKDKDLNDIWDCSKKSVGNYWIVN